MKYSCLNGLTVFWDTLYVRLWTPNGHHIKGKLCGVCFDYLEEFNQMMIKQHCNNLETSLRGFVEMINIRHDEWPGKLGAHQSYHTLIDDGG